MKYVELVEETITEGKKEYVIWGIKPNEKEESLLLVNPGGKSITDKNIANKFKKWAEDKVLPKFAFKK
jgi:hypothetical protein